jgi:AcrR family transcriptional regulator
MARTYTKAKRAEQEAETRQRIVEATVGLHTEVGPARTTISMIAERAGVQRHTVYSHFPGELELLMACSGHTESLDPMPGPEAWETVNDPEVRLRRALTAIYGWYGRNAELNGNVLRDFEDGHPTVREIFRVRWQPRVEATYASLAAGLKARGKAALALALSFHTWRTLTRDAGMKPAAAADLMVGAVLAADGQAK